VDRFVKHEVKAVETGGSAAKGEFEALVAVFNNIDSYGDRILPGAFAKSLEDHGVPRLVWAHQWSIPPIGTTLKAEETPEGLVIRSQLFVDQGIELIDHIYAAMSATNVDGRAPLREFSFGYDVEKYSVENSDDAAAQRFGGEVRNLEVITCFEVGPCLVGVNPDTELLAVKGIPAPSTEPGKTGPLSEAKSDHIPDRDGIDRYLTVLTGRDQGAP
jgi:uncharacterized protein